jgi:hypothetical protein
MAEYYDLTMDLCSTGVQSINPLNRCSIRSWVIVDQMVSVSPIGMLRWPGVQLKTNLRYTVQHYFPSISTDTWFVRWLSASNGSNTSKQVSEIMCIVKCCKNSARARSTSKSTKSLQHLQSRPSQPTLNVTSPNSQSLFCLTLHRLCPSLVQIRCVFANSQPKNPQTTSKLQKRLYQPPHKHLTQQKQKNRVLPGLEPGTSRNWWLSSTLSENRNH